MLSEQRKAQIRETVEMTLAVLDSKYKRVQSDRLIFLDHNSSATECGYAGRDLKRYLDTAGQYQTVSVISPEYDGMTYWEHTYASQIMETMGLNGAFWIVTDLNDPEYDNGDTAILITPNQGSEETCTCGKLRSTGRQNGNR